MRLCIVVCKHFYRLSDIYVNQKGDGSGSNYVSLFWFDVTGVINIADVVSIRVMYLFSFGKVSC